MTREDCLKNHARPALAKGQVLRTGDFYRNLKDADVAKVYQDDDNENPAYGRKVCHRHWKDAQKRGGLSVNQVACIRSPACSLLIDNPAAKHVHVLGINLEALAARLQTPLVAQYRPVLEPDNPCHFEILSEEDGGIPPGKMPRTPAEHARATTAREQYEQIFVLFLAPLGGP
jgi:hypothetical protein